MLNLLSDPYYDMDIYVHVVSPIKFSEMVDSSVFIHPCTFSPSRTQYRGGSREVRNQRNFILEEVMEKGSLTLLVTICVL